MATPSLLITQCLQNDFVQHTGAFDPLPNLLHIGHTEALRLLGPVPSQGPIARVMTWAYGQSDDELRLVHVRDWHDPTDPVQAAHHQQFGEHCIHDTDGARFVFDEPKGHDKDVVVIDATTLNDFGDTGLAATLAPYADEPRRVGLIGVWTEAKILFLAYELRTRFPNFEVAVCSALTASSTRHHHFQGLDQLERILGVTVIDSEGHFLDWLGGSEAVEAPLLGLHDRFPELKGEGLDLNPVDARLIRYLFRDCREVHLRVLDGGFSGNVVMGTRSLDHDGHEQVPHVVKVGPQALIGRERTSFERIQAVMGNNAPHIADFADFGERGAIKYRYASMGGSSSTTLQGEYRSGLPFEEIQSILDTVFGEHLQRLYRGATLEQEDVLKHYRFDAGYADGVQRAVERIMGGPVSDTIEVLPGVTVRNPALFYSETLPALPARAPERLQMAFVHGDLNGANIILDAHRNVWLIDFFHTRRAHVLMDLLKVENDLLYIWTPIGDEHELREAMKLTDALLAVRDLAAPLSDQPPSDSPWIARAWQTVRVLRGFYPPLISSNRDPFQASVALLRYAVHTLSFDEPTPLQHRWALYAAGRCVDVLEKHLHASNRLRVDWLNGEPLGGRSVGLTILPGRRDWKRELSEDLASLKQDGVGAVMCFVPRDELEQFGVPELLDAYRDAGFARYYLPLPDQKAAGMDEMDAAVDWLEAESAKHPVMLHCVGGLGRSGLAAACWLTRRGASPDEALAMIRAARGPRAVETPVQEAFLREYAASLD